MKKPSRYTMFELVEEVKTYEARRKIEERCGMSTVQAVNCIVFNGITHAGSVAHVCNRRAGHDGMCECCGYKWKGFK